LVDDDIAALGAEGDGYRLRENLHTAEDLLARGLVEQELFSGHSVMLQLKLVVYPGGYFAITPRMSSSRTSTYLTSSIFTSVPPYLLMRARSPTVASNGRTLPSSSFLPVPSAITSASCGFSLAESGMIIPPRVCSFSSMCF